MTSHQFIITLLKIFSVFCTVLPYFVTYACLKTNRDATYFLLKELFPQSVTDKSVTAPLGFCFRIFVLLLVTSEALHSVSFILSVFLVMLNRVTRINKGLMSFGYRCERFRFYAVQFQIVTTCVSKNLNHLISIAFISLFWVVVSLVWIVVKFSPAVLSLKSYIIYLTVLVAIVIAVTVTLPLACDQVEASKSAIKANTEKAEWLRAKRKAKEHHVACMKARCIMPIKIKCGAHGYLNNEFAKTYFLDMILRCFDFILVFDANVVW